MARGVCGPSSRRESENPFTISAHRLTSTRLQHTLNSSYGERHDADIWQYIIKCSMFSGSLPFHAHEYLTRRPRTIMPQTPILSQFIIRGFAKVKHNANASLYFSSALPSCTRPANGVRRLGCHRATLCLQGWTRILQPQRAIVSNFHTLIFR
jgi:hypothetical protein